MSDPHPEPEPETAAPNALETAIRAAHAGTLPSQEVLRILTAGKLAVPTRTAMRPDLSELNAVVLDKDGKSFIAVFTTLERASALRNLAAYCVMVDAMTLLPVLDRDLGVVINPGTDVVMEIAAEGVERMVQHFRPDRIPVPAQRRPGDA